jgi:hypothetical protein
MESKINTTEKKLTPWKSSYYYPCFIDNQLALFTNNQLKVAIKRAKKYDDHYDCKIKEKSFFEKIIDLFK